MKIMASYPKIMIIDSTEMPYRTYVFETLDFRLFLEIKVQPLNLLDLGPLIPLKRSWGRPGLIPTYFKTVMDFIDEQRMFM